VIHAIRKFTITNMIRARLEFNARETFVGHKIKSMDPHYDRRDQSELLEEYGKAVDYLTIDPANRLKREVEEYRVKASQYDSKG
jgi:hypothetical protein